MVDEIPPTNCRWKAKTLHFVDVNDFVFMVLTHLSDSIWTKKNFSSLNCVYTIIDTHISWFTVETKRRRWRKKKCSFVEIGFGVHTKKIVFIVRQPKYFHFHSSLFDTKWWVSVLIILIFLISNFAKTGFGSRPPISIHIYWKKCLLSLIKLSFESSLKIK